MATGRLNPVLRYLGRVSAAGGLTDGQMLDRYRQSGDRAAFTALVERHGPMVLSVCRRVLGNVHDAEDAFQAVFLVLVRKARSIGKRESVGSWLHGVAVRIAKKARTATARRRFVERQAATTAVSESTPETIGQELRPILDEEIARLPERYRLPVILCYLQGKTHTEAARQLGWPKGTVATQLARARIRLRRRLEWRGITLSVTSIAAMLAQTAPAAVPFSLMSATVAIAASGTVAPAVSALAKGALMPLFLTKLRSVTFVMIAIGALGAGAGLMLRKQALAANADHPAASAPVPVAPPEKEPTSISPPEPEKPSRQFLVECLFTEKAADGTEKVRAEPRLMTCDGHTAMFLQGGQVALPQASDGLTIIHNPTPMPSVPAAALAKQHTGNTGPRANRKENSRQPTDPKPPRFRPFGTQLNVTATSLEDGWLLLELEFSHSVLEDVRESRGDLDLKEKLKGQSKIVSEPTEQLLIGPRRPVSTAKSVAIRGRTVYTVLRIKPGDTVTLDLDPAKPGEQPSRLSVTVRESDASTNP